jgi:hypothetical protein
MNSAENLSLHAMEEFNSLISVDITAFTDKKIESISYSSHQPIQHQGA